MEQAYDASSPLGDAARHWLIRLSSGDMTQDELCEFRRWTEVPAQKQAFGIELAKWRQLEVLRPILSPDRSSDRPANEAS
ncbi:MAG TPA: DUF4880 domain-containing protein [Sphingobium sp.]|uniref:DUF4880 domain-containing protein n=1 Tax=Sphingobium sp. TaxID=1912891 RepID=UPI002ED21BC2